MQFCEGAQVTVSVLFVYFRFLSLVFCHLHYIVFIRLCTLYTHLNSVTTPSLLPFSFLHQTTHPSPSTLTFTRVPPFTQHIQFTSKTSIKGTFRCIPVVSPEQRVCFRGYYVVTWRKDSAFTAKDRAWTTLLEGVPLLMNVSPNFEWQTRSACADETNLTFDLRLLAILLCVINRLRGLTERFAV